ncbi:MAG: hypothetical protein AAF547_16650 [Actinomycetota bacterium]
MTPLERPRNGAQILYQAVRRPLDRRIGAAAPDRAGPQPPTDRSTTLAIIDELTERAGDALRDHDDLGGLPHPTVTTATLNHHLAAAADRSEAVDQRAGGSRRIVDPIVGIQAALNDALIHCVHQLDHRSRLQDRRLTELEARLAEADRRIASLEARTG